jgi:hypothetical protein
MEPDLISKKARTLFEDHLVDGSTLHRISAAFAAANVAADTSYKPSSKGQRRTLVGQYYRALDFSKREDVQRLLRAYAAVIEDFEDRLRGESDRLAAEARIESLKQCLAEEGFAYRDGKVKPVTPATREVFEDRRSITELTRRAIFDYLVVNRVVWHGRFDEVTFLERLFDLQQLPSTDVRFDNMRADILQHTGWDDWSNDWVFVDQRLDLLGCDDSLFIRFLCEVVHPVVRPDREEGKRLTTAFNEHLAADGWELAPGTPISGRTTYAARRRGDRTVALPDVAHATDILTDVYVRELSAKCDERLASGDLDGAITVARTLLEAVLGELEQRLAGQRRDHKGDLPRQFKAVTKLLRMDEARTDLDDRFKDVIRGLVMLVNGLAPLRNKLSDGHARVRKPAPHHARVVVNAAKTTASFLVESYLYQREQGLLPPAGSARGASA